jgi:hypothetical protein
MTQVNKISFESEKNGRLLSFHVPDGTPIADAFEFSKELMITFSNLSEQKQQQEVQPIEISANDIKSEEDASKGE